MIQLTSDNGRPLPLRAIPYRDLNREFWSQGKVARPERLETAAPKAVREDIPVEEMTLADLVRTQYQDPMTESRKAFYAGAGGALSLDALTDRDARRYGTPYVGPDPVIAKQIAWEKRQWDSSPAVTVTRGSDGRIAVDRWVPRETWLKLRTAATFHGLGGGPARKTWLTRDAYAEARRRVREAIGDELRRQYALAPDEWHGPQELVEDGEIVAVVQHGNRPLSRTKSGAPYVAWRGARDQVELELGTDLCADAELESWLGEDDVEHIG